MNTNTQSYTYAVFYNGKRHGDLQATSSYAAQTLAGQLLKAPSKRQYMISVVLADKPVVVS